jgi:hypothetical protein
VVCRGKAFKNEVRRKMYERRRDEVTEDWRKLYNKEF